MRELGETVVSKEFDNISAGMMEAMAHTEDKLQEARMHRPCPVNVKALPAKIGTIQE